MKNSILNKILSGLSDKNIRFGDLKKNLISLGFTERMKSSHHIFTKENVAEIINVTAQ